MSSGVRALYASNAPVKLDSIRDGVTDLGRITAPFATASRQLANSRRTRHEPTQVTKKDIRGTLQTTLLRNLSGSLISKQRRVGRTEGRVCLRNNSL